MGIVLEWVRFLAAAFFILCGAATLVVSVFGIFKFRFVLNRMHTAALGDTLGIFMVLAGLMIIGGFSFASLKVLLVISFLWLAGPVSSHLIARLELSTDEHLNEECEVEEL